jgi:hypothetical protein
MHSRPKLHNRKFAYNQEISTCAAEGTSLSLPSQIFSHGCTDSAFRFHKTFQPWQHTLTEKIIYRESCLSILTLDLCGYMVGNLETNINLHVYRVLSMHTSIKSCDDDDLYHTLCFAFNCQLHLPNSVFSDISFNP